MQSSSVSESVLRADSLDLHPTLAEELARLRGTRRHAQPDDRVFLNRYGRPWRDPRRAWKKALVAAKLDHLSGLRIHDLRHTFATHFLEGGGAVTDLQAQLGHTNLATTQRYAEMLNERRRDTVLGLDYGTRRGRRKGASRDEISNSQSNSAAGGEG